MCISYLPPLASIGFSRFAPTTACDSCARRASQALDFQRRPRKLRAIHSRIREPDELIGLDFSRWNDQSAKTAARMLFMLHRYAVHVPVQTLGHYSARCVIPYAHKDQEVRANFCSG